MSERVQRVIHNNPYQPVDLHEVVLTPDEADAWFRGAKEDLRHAAEHPYRNVLGRIRGELSGDNIDKLTSAFGVLLPLTTQECVRQGKTYVVTQRDIGNLLMDIGSFLSRFRNTGVQMITPGQIIPTMTVMLKGKDLPR